MAANLALKWDKVGEAEDGTPQFTLRPPDGEESAPMHFLITGKLSTGEIELPDGTVYDVTPQIIRVRAPEHAGLLSHHIGVQHEQAMRLGFGPDHVIEHDGDGALLVARTPHLCTDHCGELAVPVTSADAYKQQTDALASGFAEAGSGNGVAGGITFVNLHSASTGTNGANELGSTRQAIAWTTATSGSPNPSNTGAISITLAASTTAGWLGGWSAVTTGNFWIGFPLSPSVTTGTSAGTVTFAIGAVVIGST